jgi:hypothetical protein
MISIPDLISSRREHPVRPPQMRRVTPQEVKAEILAQGSLYGRE